jgi:hypothetical protein
LFGGFSGGAGNPVPPVPVPPAPGAEPDPAEEQEQREEKEWYKKHQKTIEAAKTARYPKYPDTIAAYIELFGAPPKTASAYSLALQRFINANVMLRRHRMEREDHPERYEMGKDKQAYYTKEEALMRGVRSEEDALKRLEATVNRDAKSVASRLRQALEVKIIKSNPRRQRNAEGDPSSWLSSSGLRNWIFLAGALVAGYFVYKKWVAPSLSKAFAVPSAKALSMPRKSSGMAVTANQVASTDSSVLIGARRPGYDYARVIITRTDGSKEFVPSSSGTFTGNLLQEGGSLWAEILPA